MLRQVKKLVKRKHNKRILRRDIEITVAKVFGRKTAAYKNVMLACDIAKNVHRGKRRKNGEPLINHERAVVLILLVYLKVRDPDIIIAAFLHDLVEDYDNWDLERVAAHFGWRVAGIVDAVTKPDLPEGMEIDLASEIIFDKVWRGGYEARILKYADRLHNMITLWGDRTKKARKIRETALFVIPLAARDNVLWGELTMAAAEQIRTLGLDRRVILAGAAE